MLEEAKYQKSHDEIWPPLSYQSWKDTYATLHMWTQIVGKIELKLNPAQNHFWDTAYLVTPRGLSTYPIFFENRCFDIEFNFIEHLLKIYSNDGKHQSMSLEVLSVSEFYYELMKILERLGINVKIDTRPQEVPHGIPFPMDKDHHSYDRKYVERFFKILVQADRLMKEFRAGFAGKSSPVHFFWGSFDLATTRFSGRLASSLSATDKITMEAYSHEVMSVGFWPGSANILEAAFYAYMAPEPQGYASQKIEPQEAFYNPPTKGFILRYEDVRRSTNPDKMVLDFFRSSYEAGATLAHWDRTSLERKIH